MNNLILLSDPHLTAKNFICRTDDVMQTQLEKFRFVRDYSNEHEALLLIAGDVCDRPRSWHLLADIIAEFDLFNIQPAVVFGQHDTYLYSEETRNATTLGILCKGSKVSALSSEPLQYPNGLAIYGCHYGQSVPTPKDPEDFNVLVIHKEIADAPLYPGQNFLDAEQFLKEHEAYEIVLCGDQHTTFVHEVKGRMIVNTGPLLRKTVGLWEHKPGFFHANLETGSWKWIDIPCKPPEEVMTREHLAKVEEASEMMEAFVSSIQQTEQKSVNFVAALQTFIQANNVPQPVVDILAEVMEKADA